MPLTEMTIMDQKKEFILLWSSRRYTFTALCQHYGISRTTGYKYVKKFQTYGMEGFEPQSRAPHHTPNKISEEIEKKIVELRGKHHTWGAKKLQWKLEQEGIYNHIPARSTITNVLKRNDLIPERRKRVHVERRYPKFEAVECNDIWSADYKGEFKTKDNKYCYPLTICDTYSRFIIKIQGLSRPNLEQSKPVFEAAFKVYGLPEQLHTDNGSPFANVRSLGRYTQLSVWLMELGVLPVFSDPASPQQNGKHERMHRVLKAESCKDPGVSLRSQQIKFNRFTREYNMERPHEALGMVLPSSIYEKSKRPYSKKIKEWIYPAEYKVRNICKNGIIRVGKDDSIFVGTAFKSKQLGFEDIGGGIYRVWFREFLLGYLNEHELKIYDIMEYDYIKRV
jgi:transposase InsO family protein